VYKRQDQLRPLGREGAGRRSPKSRRGPRYQHAFSRKAHRISAE